MNNIVYADLSYKITGICFQIHKKLGRFCREKQYADTLEKYFVETGIPHKRELELAKVSNESPKGNRVDFFIDEKIILDVKAKPFITKEDYNQMQRYLIGANLKLGLIVNFRNSFLKPKRILNSKYVDKEDNSRHSHENSHNSYRSSGFTLIELILVVSIMLTLGVMTTVFYSRFLTQSSVSNVQDQLLSSLRKAQMYAMMSRKSSLLNWGVNFTGNQIILFQGNSYATKTPGLDETFSVSNTITISGWPAGGFIFTRETGIPTPAGPTTITINGPNNVSGSITVNSQGVATRN